MLLALPAYFTFRDGIEMSLQSAVVRSHLVLPLLPPFRLPRTPRCQPLPSSLPLPPPLRLAPPHPPTTCKMPIPPRGPRTHSRSYTIPLLSPFFQGRSRVRTASARSGRVTRVSPHVPLSPPSLPPCLFWATPHLRSQSRCFVARYRMNEQ